MKKPNPLPTTSVKLPRPLRADIQWSNSARRIVLAPIKYATLEALMRQATRASFFTVPSLHALPEESDKSTFVVDINVVDDAEIQELNKQYREEDHATDVLSFAQLEDKSTFEAGEEVLLGDVVISLPAALRQAEEFGHPLDEEMAFLTVHAMLHLLGYDHQKASDKKLMWEHQSTIMERICSWPPNRKR